MPDTPATWIETGFSLGSNEGDRLARLVEARDRLLDRAGARLAAQSPVYETEPVGVRPEHRDRTFLNAVIVLASHRRAGQWLHVIGDVEKAMGRVRTADRFAPRPIDIDVLFSGADCIESGILIVPHPRWAERRFVVQPLADVRPDLVLPGAGRAVREVLAALPPGEGVELLAREW
jgi:2-amino-4-hydroxy-6-hydroxymethyldihydropteridine diphosphokinase